MIGEVLRRIIGRCIVQCIKTDLKLLGGNSQLCLGQKSGIEHAIHSLRDLFSTNGNEAILQIDAKNAFNSLNRELALSNIEKICPSFHTALWNSYKIPSNLLIGKKDTYFSRRNNTRRPASYGHVWYWYTFSDEIRCCPQALNTNDSLKTEMQSEASMISRRH